MDNIASEDIHIRIDKETLNRIDRMAQEIGLKRSQLIRLIIKVFMRQQNEILRLIMMEAYSLE